MFENSAGKLKSILTAVFWIGQVVSTVFAFGLMEDTDNLSLLLIPIVFVVSWLSSLFIMAILEAMEKIYQINNMLENIEKDADCLYENVLIITKVTERKNSDLLDENNHNGSIPKKMKKAEAYHNKQYMSEVDSNEIDIDL